jgi:hypothetical protein
VNRLAGEQAAVMLSANALQNLLGAAEAQQRRVQGR